MDCATQCALRSANRRRAWYTWRNPSQHPNPLARAGRNRRASPTQTREKRRNGAAWAPILMFARGRAGAKGDVWSGILVCGHPVTGHPRATHLVHTLVHGPRSARKSSIRSMIRQFVLERPTQYDENSDGCVHSSSPPSKVALAFVLHSPVLCNGKLFPLLFALLTEFWVQS